jgi:hypothetical protein
VKPRKPSEEAFCKALFFSPPGHGKTRLLGTAADDERTYPMAFLNFEAGERTLVGQDVDIFDIRDMQDYTEAYEILSDPDTEYKSVGLDSVTETQVVGLLNILEKDAKRADPDQLAQPDWGVILVQMRRLIRHYKFLPMHVFMTALSRDDTVPRIGVVKIPAVQGAFAAELPGIMDTVGYLAMEEDDDGVNHRILLLDPQEYPRFQVKARSPWNAPAPSEIEDPTITKLLDALGYK